MRSSHDANRPASVPWLDQSVDLLKVLVAVCPCRHVCVSCQFQKVVHLMSQKAWRISDLFSAVLQFCESRGEEGRSLSGLFDWLLETL